MNALQTGALHYKQSNNIDKTPVPVGSNVIGIAITISSAFNTHSSCKSRIQNIENEIKRREEIN